MLCKVNLKDLNFNTIIDSVSYIVCIIIGLLIINIGTYKYFWHEHKYQNDIHLKVQHDLINELIISQLYSFVSNQNVINHNGVLKIKEYIKNHIFHLSSYISPNKDNSIYITLQDLLNIISGRTFIYNISVDKQKIISNGDIESDSSITRVYLIENIAYSIELSINPKSSYEVNSISRIYQKMLLVVLSSIIIFTVTITCVILLVHKQQYIKKKLKQSQLDLDNTIKRNSNILLFYKVNEDFILNCYQYSKRSIYSGLLHHIDSYSSLLTDNQNTEYNIHKIKLNQVILNIEKYFNGYAACYNNNIVLNMENTVEDLFVPFEYEVFNQLSISILSNILYFNKDTENKRYVKIIFIKNRIIYSSDGFRLDKNLAIKYSERIFNDTANLYILNLSQVCTLLENFQIGYSIFRQDEGTTIEINFEFLTPKLNVMYPQKRGEIIKLDKLRNNKKYD